jgi:pantetheine-phosphate adenylyltransferase
MKIGVFPGSFDPFTKGHESVVKKAFELFDKIYIAIGVNSQKGSLFELEKRKVHISSLFASDDKIEVIQYEGLTVDLCLRLESKYIIRGLRDSKDFEYEKSIAQMNNQLASVETVFFITDSVYSPINSSIVREIYLNGGDVSQFVTKMENLV